MALRTNDTPDERSGLVLGIRDLDDMHPRLAKDGDGTDADGTDGDGADGDGTDGDGDGDGTDEADGDGTDGVDGDGTDGDSLPK